MSNLSLCLSPGYGNSVEAEGTIEDPDCVLAALRQEGAVLRCDWNGAHFLRQGTSGDIRYRILSPACINMMLERRLVVPSPKSPLVLVAS